MSDSSLQSKRLAIVKEYFRKGDLGDKTMVDMFTEDVELYFPKFGTRSGKAALDTFVKGLNRQVQVLKHYPEEYSYILSEDRIVVEGWESGVNKDGARWPVEGHTDGRFCIVVQFRGDLICKLHIYVDPDFTGNDKERFYWRNDSSQITTRASISVARAPESVDWWSVKDWPRESS